MRAVYWVLPTEIDYGLGWVAVIIWVLNYKKQDKLHCSPGPLWSRRHNTASFLSACPTSPNKYNESDSLTNPALRLILRIVFYKSTTRKARAESQQIATCSFNPHRTKHCSFRTVVRVVSEAELLLLHACAPIIWNNWERIHCSFPPTGQSI